MTETQADALRVLILEDVPTDAELVQHELRAAGLAFTAVRVASRDDFVRALREFGPDIILADYSLPGFDGLTALVLAREQCPDVPFLFVTGTMGEERAVEALKQGAADYILKDRMSRLGSAVRRAFEEAHAGQELRESEERFRATFEQAAVGMAHVAPDGHWLRVNQKLCDIVGYTREELLDKTFQDITHPDDLDADLAQVRKLLAGEISSYSMEKRYFRKDSSIVWINLTVALVRKPSGEPNYFISVVEEITERKRDEEALRATNEQLQTLVQSSPLAIYTRDKDGLLTSWNPAAERMFGWTAAEVLGKPLPSVPDEMRAEADQLRLQLLNGEPFIRHEVRHSRRDGSPIDIDAHLAPLRDTSGKPNGTIAVVTDVTGRKQTEERLNHLAHFDSLTGLPNRLLFTDRLQQAMAHATRHERLVGVALLDLDQFKKVNDSLGHTTGDALLRQAGERLRAALRPSDTVARLGGDEFTLVLADMAHVDDATLVLQKIRQSFETPFRVDDRDLFITASIGVTLFPFDDRDIEALMRNADVAMYRAKESGRNTWQFYAADMTAKAQENMAIEHALHGAIERGELALHYQPQLNPATGRITGVEALARWRHPQLGDVSPGRFVPIAEESGLIVPLGEWALRTACAQAVRWHDAGFAPLRIAVNLSPRQLREPGFPEAVERILRETRCPAAMLEIELTEGTLLKQTENSVVALDKLNVMGVRFAIDDFGTGYSSFGYLRRFPIDVLKIDQSFVRDITTDADDAAIVRAIITMARELGMPVVAEGVETREQLEFLRAHGCDTIQGYYFSRPQPAEAITQQLTDGKTLPATH